MKLNETVAFIILGAAFGAIVGLMLKEPFTWTGVGAGIGLFVALVTKTGWAARKEEELKGSDLYIIGIILGFNHMFLRLLGIWEGVSHQSFLYNLSGVASVIGVAVALIGLFYRSKHRKKKKKGKKK